MIEGLGISSEAQTFFFLNHFSPYGDCGSEDFCLWILFFPDLRVLTVLYSCTYIGVSSLETENLKKILQRLNCSETLFA